MDARCDTCKACEVCAPNGDHFRGAFRATLLHFYSRTIWGLHQLRLVYKAAGWAVPMDELSSIIRRVEDVEDATRGEPPPH